GGGLWGGLEEPRQEDTDADHYQEKPRQADQTDSGVNHGLSPYAFRNDDCRLDQQGRDDEDDQTGNRESRQAEHDGQRLIPFIFEPSTNGERFGFLFHVPAFPPARPVVAVREVRELLPFGRAEDEGRGFTVGPHDLRRGAGGDGREIDAEV